MTNRPLDIPKTGDNSNMVLWLALMAVSAGGLIVTTTVFKKRRNQN